MKTRCEGWTRHGGLMTFGRPEWRQCENDGIVMLKVKQNAVNGSKIQTLPACQTCWQKCIDEGLKIIKATPINKPIKKEDVCP